MTSEQKRYFKNKADRDKVRYLNEQKAYYDEVEKVGLTVGTTINNDGQVTVCEISKILPQKQIIQKNNES